MVLVVRTGKEIASTVNSVRMYAEMEGKSTEPRVIYASRWVSVDSLRDYFFEHNDWSKEKLLEGLVKELEEKKP